PVSARRLRLSSPKQKRQHKTSDESADVCHVSYPALLRGPGDRTDPAYELQNDPEPDHYEGGHWDHSSAHQHIDPTPGEQNYVRPQYAGDRSRRAQIRHV